MPRTKMNGEQDKRSETSHKNVAKARIKMAQYMKKVKALRDEGSSSEEELIITHKPKAKTKQRSEARSLVELKPDSDSDSESASEQEAQAVPKPDRAPATQAQRELREPATQREPCKPSRCHSTEIDEIRQQLVDLRSLYAQPPPQPPVKERDPVVHAMRQQLIASALRF